MDAIRETLQEVDREIAEVTRKANEQVRFIADLPPGSRERHAAATMLADLNRSLEAWQSHRAHIFSQLPEPGTVTSIGLEVREAARQRLLADARRWRSKAEELRTSCSEMKNGSAVLVLQRLARDYELLADRAEKRAGHERVVSEGSV